MIDTKSRYNFKSISFELSELKFLYSSIKKIDSKRKSTKGIVIISKKIVKKSSWRNWIRRRFREIARINDYINYKIIVIKFYKRGDLYRSLKNTWGRNRTFEN